ncbi:succinate dehydrogenase, hydrophobic membrane anchor protein [bacterium]|nr:succinate dehydrogenase, hydrophobic membrane anchor protein [bacterium]
MHLMTPLARVRGLGSAKSGVHHWWVQRISALAIVPLGLWFIYSLLHMVGGGHAAMIGWFASPFNAIGMALLMWTMCYHAFLGLQVIVEDYVHCHLTQTASIILIKFVSFLLAAVSVLSIIKMHLLGA